MNEESIEELREEIREWEEMWLRWTARNRELEERVKKLEEGDLGLWHGKGCVPYRHNCWPDERAYRLLDTGDTVDVVHSGYDRLFEGRKREEP